MQYATSTQQQTQGNRLSYLWDADWKIGVWALGALAAASILF